MSDTETFHLTTKDCIILEVMRERYQDRDETMTAILERKVSRALVVSRDDIPSNVVTLSTRVAYRVNGDPAETRIVAHDEMRGLIGMLLSITNPRGLALLGLAEGQSMTITKADGSLETLTVQEVIYQPEAARRERAQLTNKTDPRQSGPILRIVYSSDGLQERSTNRAAVVVETGFDDPGPSAA